MASNLEESREVSVCMNETLEYGESSEDENEKENTSMGNGNEVEVGRSCPKKTVNEKPEETVAAANVRKETHKAYSIPFKLEAVAFSEMKSKEAAARKYGVAPKRIREWVKQKDKLKECMDKPGWEKRKKLEGAGRKPMSTNLEEKLFDWISEMLEKRNRVSRKMVRNKARELSRQDVQIREDVEARGDSNFIASNGWLNRFFRRHSLTLRRKTTQGQKIPLHYMQKLKNFIYYIRSLRIKNFYGMADMYAMDETAVWLDMPGSTTVSGIGESSVPICTTGHEKSRITVCLTAKANGTKLPPMIIFKGKRMDRDVAALPGVIPMMSDNGWMNENLTLQYLHSTLGRMTFNRRLLVWDSYSCHISQAVKQEARKMKVDLAIIPGGCTGIIQVCTQLLVNKLTFVKAHIEYNVE